MSTTSVKKTARVDIKSDTPNVNMATSSTANGTTHQVTYSGCPNISMISTSGISDSPRFTNPFPTAATAKIVRGTNTRLSSPPPHTSAFIAKSVVCEKKVQKTRPVSTYTG